METFQIPAAAAGYGSTEAGGLTHLRLWRRGELAQADGNHLGLGHRVGRVRPDAEWKLGENDEIFVRGKEPGVLFDGYWVNGGLNPDVDETGWFATGDLGRQVGDELEFVQRLSEAIRVRGEYVPIQYVEHQIAVACEDLDIALWKSEGGDASDERAVLYVAGDSLPVEEIKSAIAGLPRFMRPVEVVRIKAMPVDGGAGKVRKSQLSLANVIESYEL
jgi:acyl-CoA synthetase (AMP-forming)/AMP-acid ligase II